MLKTVKFDYFKRFKASAGDGLTNPQGIAKIFFTLNWESVDL